MKPLFCECELFIKSCIVAGIRNKFIRRNQYVIFVCKIYMDIYFVEYKFAKKLFLPKFVSTPYEAYQMKFIVSSAKYSTLNNFNYIYLDFTIIVCLLLDLNFMCFIFYSPHPMS